MGEWSAKAKIHVDEIKRGCSRILSEYLCPLAHTPDMRLDILVRTVSELLPNADPDVPSPSLNHGVVLFLAGVSKEDDPNELIRLLRDACGSTTNWTPNLETVATFRDKLTDFGNRYFGTKENQTVLQQLGLK